MKKYIFLILLFVVLIVFAFFCEWVRLRTLAKLMGQTLSEVTMKTPDGQVLEVNVKNWYDSDHTIVEATSEDGRTYLVHILERDKEESK